ncbi:MAG: CehA/McbA family metallohydrolase [Bacteroidetes bacterium]|nr:CehA/McbA family metallohydrolase [Bacteroidota bacterium]
MFEYVGAIHIHSSFSDGSGTIEEIASHANDAELDFILLTDHNTLRAYHEGFEKWYDNTLLLVGCEINDKENKNHYLAFNIEETFSTRIPAKEYVHKVKKSGGIGFIAHPDEKRSSMKEHPPYPWVEWDCEEFTGIEIWNHMSEWMEGLTEENKYNYFVHPLKSIVSPAKVTLDRWDALAQKRRVVGIGGIDAHAHKINLLGFFEVEVFPYKVLFRSIRTHIITDEELTKQDFGNSKKIVYDALEQGRCFISNSNNGDAGGFRFFAECNGINYQMGSNVPSGGDIKLRVLLPNISGEIRLIHNGKCIDSVDNNSAEFFVSENGVYRVEVFNDNKAWIFSNHIRIGS